MTEKVDPPRFDNESPLQGEIGGGSKDSDFPRSSNPQSLINMEWPKYIWKLLTDLANLIHIRFWIFLLALTIVYAIFATVYMSTRPESPLEVLALVGIVFLLIALLAYIDKSRAEKRIKNSGESGEGEFRKDPWHSPLINTRKEFIDFYKTFNKRASLISVKGITRKMLVDRKFDTIKKSEVNLQNYRSSGLFREGSNADFIEPIPPLNAPRIYAMELIYTKEDGHDRNQEGINLNLANTPVPDTKNEWWWWYPWSEVLVNLSLITSDKNVGRIISQLLDAFERDKRGNFTALQLCCKIASSGAKIGDQALTDLLKILAKENLQITKDQKP